MTGAAGDGQAADSPSSAATASDVDAAEAKTTDAVGPADEAGPRLSDAEMLARFQDSRKRPPCSETLGARLTAVDQAARTIEMAFQADAAFANPTGAVQGGFLAAMLDEAMSVCCIIASNVRMTAPTLEMKISFLRPAFPGPLAARARALRFGKSIAFLEGELFDPEGGLIAKASATAAPRPFRRF
jgi:uncharacterized protein (TIGR00369 family)